MQRKYNLNILHAFNSYDENNFIMQQFLANLCDCSREKHCGGKTKVY
jgi:hypothetical protein